MKCLVVIAHPVENSFCLQVSRQIVDELNSADHSVIIEDLYQEKFDPVLSKHERNSYHADAYRGDLVKKQAHNLVEAEILILIFPTWWFGFPAVLKGWFDRVWSPGVAFDHGENFGPIKPRLFNLQRVLVVTSLGAPWWMDWIVMGRPVRRMIKTALLRACAPRAKLDFLSMYNSETLNKKRFAVFSQKVKNTINGW